ncbi:MAG: GAF domain-containing protein [Chloroflexi bacterium]|nr:GAF domain-containing protein [Chloroflexota bacterium]
MTKLTPSTTEEQSLAESTNPQRTFWGTIGLGAVLLALSTYVLSIILQQETTSINNFAILILTAIFLASAAGLILTIRKQQRISIQMLFFAINAIALMAVILFQGRALPASFSLLLISTMAIAWLFPNDLKRLYAGLLAANFILIWIVEILNPAWRVQLPAVTAGPIAAIFFILALLIIMIRQAWRNARTSLRHRITLTIILATSISVLLVGGYFLYESYSNLSSQSVKSLEEASGKNAKNIQRFLDGLEEDVHFLSSSVVLKNYLTSDDEPLDKTRTDLEKEFFEFAQTRLIYDQIRFINIDGQEIVRVNTSREGISTIVDQENLQNKATRGYFTGSINLSDGTLFISALDLNVEQGKVEEPHKPVIRYATPVFVEGTLHGIVITNVFAENFLAPLGEGATENYLIDKDGYYLYNNDQSKRWGRDLETGIILSQDHPVFSQSLLSGDIEPFNDGELFFASTAITLTDETSARWHLVSQMSEKSVFAPANRALLIGFAIMILTALAGVLITNVSFRSTISSVDHLTKTAQQIASGDLNAVAETKSEDEIGVLAETFNSMTAQLQETLQGLEERVADRTRNLELAAEVGRSVSQVQDLDIMLRDACDRILKEFDLYYVQVYLTDQRQKTLNLEAGTGSVGEQLLEREHSLPFSITSINGRAAVERRAVVIPDTSESPTFLQNPLLPETRGEMAVPLIAENQVVGVLDMQSSQPNTLTEENLSAFQALAGQLAIAIRNAYLLEETERAREEVEEQARRQIRTNWDEHLDAIHKPEQIGYLFDRTQVSPLSDVEEEGSLPDAANAVSAPISLIGEELGSLIVEIDEENQNAQTAELVSAVARQIAQQIESLRLLEEAERYRLNAEETARRQTIEGWQTYIESRDKEELGYLYDTNTVQPLESQQDTLTDLTLPLKARGEEVGKLAIQTEDDESIHLANAVADRLGEHIESLRLFEETRRGQLELDKRAQQLSTVAEISTATSTIQDTNEMLENMVHLTQRGFGLYHAHVFTYHENTDELAIVACGYQEGDEHEGTHGTTTIPVSQEQSLVARAARTRQPVIVNDVQNEPGWLPNPLLPETRAELAVPMVVGDELLGVLDVQSEHLNAFTDEDANIQLTLASQVAIALQNAYSFDRAQRQAEREAMLNTINQKIQNATSVEAVLQIAARELGHALGAPMTVAQLSIKDQE